MPRKTIVINKEVNAAAELKWNINIVVEFIPDEVIVRQVYLNDSASGAVETIVTDLSPTGVLGIAIDAANSIAPNTIIPLGVQVHGTYNFELRDAAGALETAAGGTSFALVLEFVKHKA